MPGILVLIVLVKSARYRIWPGDGSGDEGTPASAADSDTMLIEAEDTNTRVPFDARLVVI